MPSAQAVFYTALRDRILAVVDNDNKPVFKTCRLWNNQLPYNKDEQSFQFPAVFIHFASLRTRNLQAGVQYYDMVVRFYVGFANYELEDLDLLTMKDYLDFAIVNTKPVKANVDNGTSPGWIPLNKIQEYHDDNDTSVYKYILEYAGSLIDLVTSSLPPLILKAPPTNLDVTGEIVHEITE